MPLKAMTHPDPTKRTSYRRFVLVLLTVAAVFGLEWFGKLTMTGADTLVWLLAIFVGADTGHRSLPWLTAVMAARGQGAAPYPGGGMLESAGSGAGPAPLRAPHPVSLDDLTDDFSQYDLGEVPASLDGGRNAPK